MLRGGLCDDGRMGFGEHLERFWPGGGHEDLTPQRDGLQELLPGFRVRRIAPRRPGEPWLYATVGAADAAGDGEDGAEFVVLAPAADPVLVEMLGALASVNADPARRLGVGSLLALPRPWTAGARAEHLLVLPPYPFGPGFEAFEHGARRIVVLWLVPITASEAQHVREEGYEALEQLIAAGSANVVDPARASLV